MSQHLGCGRTSSRVQGQKRREELVAGGCKERELCADDGANGLVRAGEAEGAGVGETLEAGPGLLGGDAA